MVHFSMYAKGVFSERGGMGMTWTKPKGVSFFVFVEKRTPFWRGRRQGAPAVNGAGQRHTRPARWAAAHAL